MLLTWSCCPPPAPPPLPLLHLPLLPLPPLLRLQVTVATALAGRGTDILLGGNSKGLVGMLLENKLLDRLAAGAPRRCGAISTTSWCCFNALEPSALCAPLTVT